LQYINPLVFLIFIYFPGLSLGGGLIGVSIFLLLLSQKKKIPRGRLYDIFSLSFLPAFVVNMMIAELVNSIFTRKFSFILLSLSVIYSIVFGIFFIMFQKGKVKEGTIGISTLLVFSFLSLLENILLTSNKRSLVSNREIITLSILLVVAILLLVKQKIGGKKSK
jgi:prolipoprotein diacylglyceryltransferase